MAKSIIQNDRKRCYLCGRPALWNDPLDEHHVFFGPFRQQSEKYGLKVYLHHFSCHIYGKESVHRNGAVCRKLQKEVQIIAMRRYDWSIENFIKIFGKNRIDISELGNRCVSCGAIVPEGRQICASCENGRTDL